MSGCGCGGAHCRLAAGDARHGSANGYSNLGCRCPPCRDVGILRLRQRSPERIASDLARKRERGSRHTAAYWRAWRKTPAGRASARAAEARRRDRERSRYCGCDTPANLAAVWRLDAGRCAYCNAPGTDYEHVVPLARGGWGCVSNFRISCKSCNSRKGTKPLSVFLAALAASGTPVRPGATNSGLPCPQGAARMATRMLTA